MNRATSRRPPIPPGQARTRARTHAQVLDPDVPGYCTCGLALDHVSHTLPPMTTEQHAAEDRRLGEREAS